MTNVNSSAVRHALNQTTAAREAIGYFIQRILQQFNKVNHSWNDQQSRRLYAIALRADAQKELDELPTPAQLKERYPDTSRWDARLKAALHKRRPMLKRVLVAAMTLVILTLGALAVSADFRKAVYTMIQKVLTN